MDSVTSKILWKNVAACIDMFGSCIGHCPAPLWQSNDRFFYLSYHCLVFLDYYLSFPVASYTPVLPYTLADMNQLPAGAIDDVQPTRRYTQEEILQAVSKTREKARQAIMFQANWEQPWIAEEEINMHGLCPAVVIHYSLFEITLYNLRHLQHHVGQLNLLLREQHAPAADWIAEAD